MNTVFRNRLLSKSLGRRLLVSRITSALSGRLQDLRKLLALVELGDFTFNRGLSAFLSSLGRDIDEESGMAGLFVRVGNLVSRRGKRKLVENLIYNWTIRGGSVRRFLASDERWVPSLVVVSPTMRCNLNCTGCYSGLYTKDGELSETEMDDIFAQCREMGVYFVVISGGEPYTMKRTLLKLFKKYNDMYFLTYTNGTLLDEPTVRRVAKLGNVAPAISVEGYGEHTDARRGSGVYGKVSEAMALLKKHRVLFGVSVTYTRDNIDLITRDEFIRHYLDKGVIFAWYFMFMPVGRDPILELVPTPEQRLYCGRQVERLRRLYPLFMADFWNDGPAVGGCLAGARNYLHILNSGRIEPCVFAHFGIDNIRDKSILEAANSPFFKAIRREFPYNDEGNLKRPCMIIDNPEVLRKVVAEHLVPQGHEHSEDIIRDPRVVEWVDEYASRFKSLVDPIWSKMIENPKNRWYRQGRDYRNLFRFNPDRTPSDLGAARANRSAPKSLEKKRETEESRAAN
jgi:MoaA/NifB/PqqE/SkfB family radical SAM enzyme